MTIGKHLTYRVGDGETFKRKESTLHALAMIYRTPKNFLSRRSSQQFASFRHPELAKPIVADRTKAFDRPATKAKLIVHGPGSIRICRMNNDRTEWQMAGKELGYFKACSRIA